MTNDLATVHGDQREPREPVARRVQVVDQGHLGRRTALVGAAPERRFVHAPDGRLVSGPLAAYQHAASIPAH